MNRIYRNYFIAYSAGVASVVSLLSVKMFFFNYLVIFLPIGILGIVYLIKALINK